jgi:interferon gamma-inducible protein 30
MAQWQMTDMLSPTLQFVPWITLNGEHDDQIQNGCQVDLVACVCAVYEGDSEACDIP